MIKTNTLVGLATAAVLAAAPALAADVKVGILGDITGPIESLAPPIVAGAQLAFDEVNAQGGILGGGKIVVVTGDPPATRRLPARPPTSWSILTRLLPSLVPSAPAPPSAPRLLPASRVALSRSLRRPRLRP